MAIPAIALLAPALPLARVAGSAALMGAGWVVGAAGAAGLIRRFGPRPAVPAAVPQASPAQRKAQIQHDLIQAVVAREGAPAAMRSQQLHAAVDLVERIYSPPTPVQPVPLRAAA